MRITRKRKEMGEVAWTEYQKQRKNEKAKVWAARNVQKVIDWRRRTKEKLVAYKGGKCEICGYNKPFMSCYDFPHKNPKQKEFGIGGKGLTRSLEKLKKEVDKCLLLCRNCHGEIHDKEYAEQRTKTTERYQKWLNKFQDVSQGDMSFAVNEE
jgi:hypothetical protein